MFAVDRNFFFEIGAYDQGMAIGGGGENVELSLRVWMCGGVIEYVPCSRVGHVVRKEMQYDYMSGTKNAILNHNAVRVAEIWIDDYREFFYRFNGGNFFKFCVLLVYIF